MAKKAKVGRPRFPKGTAKSRIVPVRFSAEDFKRVVEAARDAKLTLSDWIRSTLHAALK